MAEDPTVEIVAVAEMIATDVNKKTGVVNTTPVFLFQFNNFNNFAIVFLITKSYNSTNSYIGPN